MTARKIAERTWALWHDFYQEGLIDSSHILHEIEMLILEFKEDIDSGFITIPSKLNNNAT